ACEVLRFADDLRFVRGLFKRRLVAGGEYCKCVNLLILAIAAIVVGIEVADQSALDNRSHGFLGGNAGRRDEGEAADSARLERAHGGSRDTAQIVSGKLFRGTAADQQQAL